MKRMGLTLIYLPMILACLTSCRKEPEAYVHGSVQVFIEPGENWIHDFPLFMGIKLKNPPQVAVWLEDTQGNYISTVYVTNKIATQSWKSSGGSRRKESLPHWCYSRGVQYADGLYLPTKDNPLPDAITGATPRSSFEVKINPVESFTRFIVKVEVNHSTDFNEHYPQSATESDGSYSGGRGGSGQPALIYAADVDLTTENKSFDAVLVGHSSPDGTSGKIYADVSGLTTAKRIVERITVTVK